MNKKYPKLILALCIAPSSMSLYAMDAKYQSEAKRVQAEVKASAAEPVAGLQEPDAQVQIKLAWSDQVKIPVSAAALQQSAMLKATHEGDKDATEIPVEYKQCTQQQFERFCELLELAAQNKQQELRALLQQLTAADLLAIYHVGCYYDVKAIREEIIKALPDSLTALAKKDGIKAVQDLLKNIQFLGEAAGKEFKDGFVRQHPQAWYACGKLQQVGDIEGRRATWSSIGDLAVIHNQDVLIYRNYPQMGSTGIIGGLKHPATVQEIVWHPDGKRLVTLTIMGSVFFWYHDGDAWQQQIIHTPQVDAQGYSNAALSAHWLDAQSLVFISDATENNVQHWSLYGNELRLEHTSTVTKFWGGRNLVDFQWCSQGCVFVARISRSIAQGAAVTPPGIISYEYGDGQWRLLKNSILDGVLFDVDGLTLDQAAFGVLGYHYNFKDKDKLRFVIYKPDQQGRWSMAHQILPNFPNGTGLGDNLSLRWWPIGVNYNMALSSDGLTLAIHKRIHYARDETFGNTNQQNLFPWKSFVYLLRKQENNAWRLIDTREVVDYHDAWQNADHINGSVIWSAQCDRLAVTSFHGDVHILGFGENITNISVKDLLLTMVTEQLKDSSAGASVLQRDKTLLEESAKKSPALKNALRIQPKWYTREGLTQRVQKVQRWIKRNPKAALALCVAGGLLAYYAKKRLAPRVKKSIIMPLAARLKRKASK